MQVAEHHRLHSAVRQAEAWRGRAWPLPGQSVFPHYCADGVSGEICSFLLHCLRVVDQVLLPVTKGGCRSFELTQRAQLRIAFPKVAASAGPGDQRLESPLARTFRCNR